MPFDCPVCLKNFEDLSFAVACGECCKLFCKSCHGRLATQKCPCCNTVGQMDNFPKVLRTIEHKWARLQLCRRCNCEMERSMDFFEANAKHDFVVLCSSDIGWRLSINAKRSDNTTFSYPLTVGPPSGPDAADLFSKFGHGGNLKAAEREERVIPAGEYVVIKIGPFESAAISSQGPFDYTCEERIRFAWVLRNVFPYVERTKQLGARLELIQKHAPDRYRTVIASIIADGEFARILEHPPVLKPSTFTWSTIGRFLQRLMKHAGNDSTKLEGLLDQIQAVVQSFSEQASSIYRLLANPTDRDRWIVSLKDGKPVVCRQTERTFTFHYPHGTEAGSLQDYDPGKAYIWPLYKNVIQVELTCYPCGDMIFRLGPDASFKCSAFKWDGDTERRVSVKLKTRNVKLSVALRTESVVTGHTFGSVLAGGRDPVPVQRIILGNVSGTVGGLRRCVKFTVCIREDNRVELLENDAMPAPAAKKARTD